MSMLQSTFLNLRQAFEIDEKILQIWQTHPNRLIITGKEHFFEKAELIKNFVENLLKDNL